MEDVVNLKRINNSLLKSSTMMTNMVKVFDESLHQSTKMRRFQYKLTIGCPDSLESCNLGNEN